MKLERLTFNIGGEVVVDLTMEQAEKMYVILGDLFRGSDVATCDKTVNKDESFHDRCRNDMINRRWHRWSE